VTHKVLEGKNEYIIILLDSKISLTRGQECIKKKKKVSPYEVELH
jgi:hypothetical protein